MALFRALRATALMAVVLVGVLAPPVASEQVGDAVGGDGGGAAAAPAEGGAGASQGLYFFVSKKGPKRCYVIREGRGSVFHVHYDFPAAKDNAKILLELRHLLDDSSAKERFSDKPILTKDIEKEEGIHQFKIPSDGSYTLCAVTDVDKPGRGLRLALDFDTGENDILYDKVKKKYDLNDVQISMVKLKNRAKQMLREADFMKELEMDHHRMVLTLNREAIWWPITQVVLLIAMGTYQVRHLKQFFKAKRLV